MPATHMTEEQEEAQKHGFMHPANPNMADQTGAKCCNATPDPFDRAPGAAQPQSGGEVLVAMSEETKDGFGLDKEQRLLAKRLGKEEEEADQAAGLEPPFPYVMARFDAEFFEL